MAVGLFYIHDILDTFVFHPRSRATLVYPDRKSRDVPETRLALHGLPNLARSFIKVQGAVITLYHEKAALLLHATAPPLPGCRKARTELAKYSSECEREYIKFVLTQIISRGDAFRDLVE